MKHAGMTKSELFQLGKIEMKVDCQFVFLLLVLCVPCPQLVRGQVFFWYTKGVSVVGASVGECSGNHFLPVFELPLLSSLFLGPSERTVLSLPCWLFSPCRNTPSGKTGRKDFTSILGHFSFLSWDLFVLLSCSSSRAEPSWVALHFAWENSPLHLMDTLTASFGLWDLIQLWEFQLF